MVRGLYTSATGMAVQRQRMDVLTNNLVNAETTGFKKDTLVTSTFDAVMLRRINDPNVSVLGGSGVGTYDYGTFADELYTDLSQGGLEQTGRATDLAIRGDGFFTVETPEGERYTRSGDFTVNAQGYLVTQDGSYVLGENGRVYTGSGAFTVSSDGTVAGQTAAGDRLRLVNFADPGALRKEGNNLYYAYGGETPLSVQAEISQGALESSNVDISKEMVDMISVYRKFEASQKIAGMTDESLGLAVNLGKVGG